MMLDFIDVRMNFVHAKAIRRVYVQLRGEDYEEVECGLLSKAMYGTRDAAQNCAGVYEVHEGGSIY